jgi:hypothetical protein
MSACFTWKVTKLLVPNLATKHSQKNFLDAPHKIHITSLNKGEKWSLLVMGGRYSNSNFRWSDTSTPENRAEAAIFLSNAVLHLLQSGPQFFPTDAGIILMAAVDSIAKSGTEVPR